MKSTIREDYPNTYKICLVGDKSVGKKQLLNSLSSHFEANGYLPTIGNPYIVKTYNFESSSSKREVVRIAILKWTEDSSYMNVSKDSLLKVYFRHASCVVLVFDVTNPQSLVNIRGWVELALERIGKWVPFILIGTKSDLEHRVDETSVKEIAQELNASFYYVSSKSSEEVKTVFEKIARTVYDKINERRKKKG